LCASTFKYREVQTSETKAAAAPSKPDSSTAKARLEEAILAKGAAREMMARHRESRFLLGKTSYIRNIVQVCCNFSFFGVLTLLKNFSIFKTFTM
jgi:hypothetical protein